MASYLRGDFFSPRLQVHPKDLRHVVCARNFNYATQALRFLAAPLNEADCVFFLTSVYTQRMHEVARWLLEVGAPVQEVRVFELLFTKGDTRGLKIAVALEGVRSSSSAYFLTPKQLLQLGLSMKANEKSNIWKRLLAKGSWPPVPKRAAELLMSYTSEDEAGCYLIKPWPPVLDELNVK